MDYLKLEKKFDGQGMLELIESFPAQFEQALEKGYSWKPPKQFAKKYSGVLIQGMGGSGIGGIITRELVKKKAKIPIYVNRDYSIPGFVDKNWLGVFVSCSGNTEETLSAFKEAKKRKMNIVCISSGGILSKKCGELILIHSGFPPRSQLAMTFVPIMAVLDKLGIAKYRKELSGVKKFLKVNKEETRAKGVKLAEFLKGNIPVIYSESRLSAAAERFHAQLAENSKVFSHWHVFPELNHNETVGWGSLEKKLAFVFFRSKKESIKEKTRIDFTKKLAGRKSPAMEIFSTGSNSIERTFYLIALGDFASFYLAMLRGIDPMPVKNIEKLKRKLK